MSRSPLCLALWITLAIGVAAQPRHLYLTWDNPDAAHSQTVVFQTTAKAVNPRVESLWTVRPGKLRRWM